MNIVEVENKLLVLSENIGVSVYDYDFELFFSCKHPYMVKSGYPCVLRKGAISDYKEEYEALEKLGVPSVNTPEQHLLASELSEWYEHIQEFTPYSICVDQFPEIEEIEDLFGWPIFIKGSRQTNRHNPELSIARNASDYLSIRNNYKKDPILHWQKVAIRKFIKLDQLAESVPGKVQASKEYRTFWWYGKLVGWGCYWYQIPKYSDNDIDKGLAVAQIAATRLKVPFIAIDIAKTASGDWIIIECNDAQESGYAGVPPKQLWENVLKEICV